MERKTSKPKKKSFMKNICRGNLPHATKKSLCFRNESRSPRVGECPNFCPAVVALHSIKKTGFPAQTGHSRSRRSYSLADGVIVARGTCARVLHASVVNSISSKTLSELFLAPQPVRPPQTEKKLFHDYVSVLRITVTEDIRREKISQ